MSALEIDADNVQAWLWLSGALENEQDRLECLENVLRIDPQNQAAAKGVAYLVGKGIVSTQSSGQPVVEADVQPQEEIQGGWQHEMPEETPAAPTDLQPTVAPASQEIVAPPQTPGDEVPPAAPSETTAEAETAVAPAVESAQPGEDLSNLRETFFPAHAAAEGTFPGWMAPTPGDEVPPAAPSETTAEAETAVAPAVESAQPGEDLSNLRETFFPATAAADGTFPGWMAQLTGDEVPPAAPSETPAEAETAVAPAVESAQQGEDLDNLRETFFPASAVADGTFPGWMAQMPWDDAASPMTAPAEQTLSSPAEAQASPLPAPIPAAEVQPSGETVPQAVETPARPTPAATLPEKTLLKIRPSLVTTIFVYGLGVIILFLVIIGLVLVSASLSGTVFVSVLALLFILLIVMLVLLMGKSLSHLMTSYTLTNRRVYLEKGVFKRGHKSIPFFKIKNITLHQGLLQKIIGMGNLTIHIATPAGKEELDHLMDVSKAAQVIKSIDDAHGGES